MLEKLKKDLDVSSKMRRFEIMSFVGIVLLVVPHFVSLDERLKEFMSGAGFGLLLTVIFVFYFTIKKKV